MVGTGNVATVLSRVLTYYQHQIVQVIGRDEAKRFQLADEVGASATGFDSPVSSQAQLCIVAVSDAALNEVVSQLIEVNCPLVHTAGSQPMEVFKNFATEYGIFYPLQTLRKEMHAWPPIPILLDGNTPAILSLLKQLASSISDRVEQADDEKRGRLHVAAVTVCNFTNHLYFLAEKYCQEEGLHFDLLRPLILQTAERVMAHSPASVQTGPAVRKDLVTIEKHLEWLHQHPYLKEIYLLLSGSIMDRHL